MNGDVLISEVAVDRQRDDNGTLHNVDLASPLPCSRIITLLLQCLLTKLLHSLLAATTNGLKTLLTVQLNVHCAVKGIDRLDIAGVTAWFLADRTNGRAIATLLRLSSVVCL